NIPSSLMGSLRMQPDQTPITPAAMSMLGADLSAIPVFRRRQQRQLLQSKAAQSRGAENISVSARVPVEFFPALSAIGICRHAFITRVPGIDVSANKAEALKALDNVHHEARHEIGIGDWPLLTAQQIHGDKIAVVDQPIHRNQEFAGCDGLITNQRRIA